MIINPQVPLHRLILSLSEALDYVHPDVADHQHRVAYIAINLGRRLGFQQSDLLQLFHAAALHDIGLLRVENRIQALHLGALEQVSWHCEAGFELLKNNPLFGQAAEIIRFHHLSWGHGQGSEHGGQRVPFASHILVLADAAERAIDRNVPILDQAPFITRQITSQADTEFHPDCVDAFCDIAGPPAFWLDCVSKRIYSVLLEQMDWPTLTVDEKTLEPIAKIFAHVVDAGSHWTATHSSGVAASAVALAERLNFSPRELLLMQAAGYLHDLGKLTVPSRILDRPAKLTPADWSIMKGHTYYTFRILNTIGGLPQISEWAAFHHERLDGSGYPFCHKAEDITLGSRIMAVADVLTAITEDRPYRKGMTKEDALAVLQKLTDTGGLDGDIVSVVRHDYEAIDSIRRQEQAAYADKQARLAEITGALEAAGV